MPDHEVRLSDAEWQDRRDRHSERVNLVAAPYLERRSRGAKHPVQDFLFTYYSQKPGQLLRWHPGAGVVLPHTAAAERADWKYYRADDDGVRVDSRRFVHERREAVDFARLILSRTAARPAQFGCFGLHEWAMAYRSAVNGVRHEYLRLRLGATGTDDVVDGARLRCTHFDAFRFYAPEAEALNEYTPTRQTQRELEQPGCLHANMDLYKWAYKLTPLLASELVMDCFELSWRIREMDMRASPYDLSAWGYPPIRIETAAGKAEYVRLQRGFAEESQLLRMRLLHDLEQALAPVRARRRHVW
ncbi:3-methyladenine DNA glycosylase [Arthrobacter echini]|uniref:3-methyladenine DNA glycosylase n=1 Tax=Arthrobacter echini TaxID=1529066 RepID=A0A4S5E315_9MICC|nr:3-methyladenine DNA glycosylase [Arthrobacter echini]THJ65804.1 3-methyladenine DNA glycosylase [Arthrobacter echini]